MASIPTYNQFLSYFIQAITIPSVVPPTPAPDNIYFKNVVDANWGTLGNWFLDAAATQPAAYVPWTSDNPYKDSDILTASSNTALYITTGTSEVPLTFGSGFTITGTSTFSIYINYCTIYSGTFSGIKSFTNSVINGGELTINPFFNPCYIDDTTINGGLIYYTGTTMEWRATAMNGGRIELGGDCLLSYVSIIQGGEVACVGTFGLTGGSTIYGGFWDNSFNPINPYPWNGSTGFLNLYP